MAFLEGLAVVELFPTAAVAMAGRYLADLGADVTVVEPASGLPLRAEPPLAPATGESLAFAYLAHGKGSVVSPEPLSEAARTLLAAADVVLHPLAAASAAQLLDEIDIALAVAVTPFDDDGRDGRDGDDFEVAASSGLLWLTGLPDAPPVLHYGRQASYFAGLTAAIAALEALLLPSGPRRIAISMREAQAAALEDALEQLIALGLDRKRQGHWLPKTGALTDLYQAQDGAVAICCYTEPQWEMLAALVDHPEWLEDPGLKTWPDRAADARLGPAIQAWFDGQQAEPAFEAMQAYRIPASLLRSPAQLLEDPQVLERGSVREVALERGGVARVPGLPFRSDPPAADASSGVVPARGSGAKLRRSPVPARPARRMRVIDLTQAWAGPFCTQTLADLGFDVVRVESAKRPDLTRLGANQAGKGHDRPPLERGLWFQHYNRNKRSISLEVTEPEGKALFLDLVRAGDVVIDNYSARVMPQLGLGFDVLSAANPGIVQVRLSGFGATGPLSNSVAYGESLEASTGLTHLTRSHGRPVRSGIAYPDPVGGLNGAIAVVAALHYRERTGRGVYVDVSERDGTMRFAGEALAEASVTGANWLQDLSAHPLLAPSGVYAAHGDERWVGLRCPDDAAWPALARVVGIDPAGLATAGDRMARRAEIDAAIAGWTAARDRDEAVVALRGAGVEAFPVLDLHEVIAGFGADDPSFIAGVQHPLLGTVTFAGPPLRADGNRPPVRHAPAWGQHTDEVLAEWLGLGGDEVGRLAAIGAIKRVPSLG